MLELKPWSINGLEDVDPSSVSLVNLCATATTISIVLNCDDRIHVLLFFSRVVAQRTTAEEALQQFFTDFHKRVRNPHAAFWLADPASWIQELNSPHWDPRNTAKHHVIMTDEIMIEVISLREPSVTIKDV